MARPNPCRFIIISDSVLRQKNLSRNEQLLLSNILNVLHNSPSGVYKFDNRFISEILHCTKKSASRIVTQLKQKGWINTNTKYHPNTKIVLRREIVLTEKGRVWLGIPSKEDTPIPTSEDTPIPTPGETSSNNITLVKTIDNNKKIHQSAFSKFWDKYDYKKDKTSALKAWEKNVKIDDYQKIFKHLDTFIPKTNKGGFDDKGRHPRPYPATYINRKRWDDEEIILPGDASQDFENRMRSKYDN